MTEPFIFANGQVAHSSKDLVQLCKDFPTDGIRYLLREDLEKWLAYIGDNQNAQYASEARTASVDDANKLDSFLSNLQNVSQKSTVSKRETTSVAVKERLETTSVVEKTQVKDVIPKTELSAEPSVNNVSETKASVAAKTVSKQEAAPKSKSNLFHWIAEFFRS